MLRDELLAIFERYGIHPKKRMSQIFLVDERVIEKEVDYAEADGKEVLEIGPGVGFLTRVLAERAGKVVAVEKDGRLARLLQDSMPESVEVIEADFLKYGVKKAEVIVSNVPYSISSPLLFKIAEMDFERAVLCFQEEFARRMVAKSGSSEYSRLSVMSQLSFEPRILQKVSRGCFFPVPRVDSALVLLKPKGKKVDELSGRLINFIFQHRNRTVRSALVNSSRNLGIEKRELMRLAEQLPFRERRVISLTLEEIMELVGKKELRERL